LYIKKSPAAHRANPEKQNARGLILTDRFYLLRIQKSNGRYIMQEFLNLMGGLMAYGLAAFGMLFIAAKMEAAEARYFERKRKQRV
jgi:hypothetical protein